MYRMAGYFNISLLSAAFVVITQKPASGLEYSSFSSIFLCNCGVIIVFAMVVAVEISQYHLTLWSCLAEVA